MNRAPLINRALKSAFCLVAGLSLVFPSLTDARECVEDVVQILRQEANSGDGEPVSVIIGDLDLRKINAKAIKKLQAKHPPKSDDAMVSLNQTPDKPISMTYVVDLNNHVFVSDGTPDLKGMKEGSLFVVKSRDAHGGEAGVLPKEMGNLTFDHEAHQFVFSPTYNMELTPEESESVQAAIEKQLPDLAFDREQHPEAERTKVLDCLDVIASQRKHGTFFLNNLISGLAINVGGLAVSEGKDTFNGRGRIWNADRGFSESGTFSVGTDLVSGVTNTALGTVGAQMVNGVGGLVPGEIGKFGVGVAGRAAVSQGIVYVNRNYVYQWLGTAKDRKSGQLAKSASKKGDFDRDFYFVKNFWDAFAVRGFMHALPPYLYSSCVQGKPLKIILSPSMIRIYEKTGVAIIYYQLRKKSTGE